MVLVEGIFRDWVWALDFYFCRSFFDWLGLSGFEEVQNPQAEAVPLKAVLLNLLGVDFIC